MKNSSQALNWFEIPVSDIQRAKAFYSKIFDITFQDVDTGDGNQYAFFPFDWTKGISGSLSQGPHYKPSEDGAVLFLNGGNDCSEILTRVATAGGKLLIPKTKISDQFGYFGSFIDTEGNKLNVHSMS
jgi:hypothetical protein